jgi:hypothetical protein
MYWNGWKLSAAILGGLIWGCIFYAIWIVLVASDPEPVFDPYPWEDCVSEQCMLQFLPCGTDHECSMWELKLEGITGEPFAPDLPSYAN